MGWASMLVSRVYLISTMMMWVYVRVGWDRPGVAMVMSAVCVSRICASWDWDILIGIEDLDIGLVKVFS